MGDKVWLWGDFTLFVLALLALDWRSPLRPPISQALGKPQIAEIFSSTEPDPCSIATSPKAGSHALDDLKVLILLGTLSAASRCRTNLRTRHYPAEGSSA